MCVTQTTEKLTLIFVPNKGTFPVKKHAINNSKEKKKNFGTHNVKLYPYIEEKEDRQLWYIQGEVTAAHRELPNL